MKTKKSTVKTYLVLVPHGETRQILRKYSEELIKNGLKDVIPFPLVAVLEELEKAMSLEELKKYARKLREEMGDSKFEIIGIGCKDKLYGAKILSQSRKDAKTIVGIFLSENKDLQLPQLPEISFRACAVANMYIKPIKNGFKYKIGKLYWLPKKLLEQVN